MYTNSDMLISGSTSPHQITASFFLGSITPPGLGNDIASDFGSSGVGRPATRISTLVNAMINPSDYPKAAYQDLSMAVNFGAQVISGYARVFVN
jgi:hypothetical protein